MASGNKTDGIGHIHYWDWPAADTAAVVTLPAPGTGFAWEIVEILYGFNGVPAAAVAITVSSGGTTYKTWPLTVDGEKKYTPSDGLNGGNNEALVVTLPAGGTGVTGYLNVAARKKVIPT